MPNHVEASPYAAANRRGILNLVWGAVATLLSGLWTAICAVGGAIGAMLRTQHAVTVISRAWGRGIIRVCGIRVEIEGLENLDGLESFVLVANHQSFFDIFAVAAYIPGEPRFVAKKSLLKIPVIGYAMKHSVHVTIDRESACQAILHAIPIIPIGFDTYFFA